MRRIRFGVFAAAAAACLVLSAGVPAAGARAHAPGRPGSFGATIFPAAGQTIEQAIADWQADVGRTVQDRKQYYDNIFPTTIDTKIRAFIDLGQTAYLCYKPAYNPPTSADADKLIASLRAFIAAGLPVDHIVLILWQELDNGHDITAAQVVAGYKFYIPLVRRAVPGIRVAIDFPGQGFPGGIAAANPGPRYVDLIGDDLYANNWAEGPRHNSLPVAISIAHSEHKPWGVYEMGDSNTLASDPSQATVTAYLQYITGLAAADRAAGLPLDAFMWYQNNAAQGYNHITSPDDYRVPLLDALDGAVTGSTR